MKRITAIVLTFLTLFAVSFGTNAAVYNNFETKDKAVFKLDGWAYEKVNTYGYEIDEYYGDSTEPGVPWSFAKEYVTSIGSYAFSENTSITSVTTTGVIESIGDYAFNGCTALSKVVLYDSLTSLGVGSFYGDSALNGINILDTKITSVPAYCFAQCGITKMALPDTCQSIGNYAFYNCSGFRKIEIPDSVTEIADTAFAGCDNLLIVCNPDSYAAQYAEANGLNYVTSDNFVVGDADGNGSVTIRDATYIQLYIAALSTLDDTAFMRADVNSDGKVNIRDVTYIQMYRAELIDSFYNI